MANTSEEFYIIYNREVDKQSSLQAIIIKDLVPGTPFLLSCLMAGVDSCASRLVSLWLSRLQRVVEARGTSEGWLGLGALVGTWITLGAADLASTAGAEGKGKSCSGGVKNIQMRVYHSLK